MLVAGNSLVIGTSGTLLLEGGEVFSDTQNFGQIAGNGTIVGNVNNDGEILPSAAQGKLRIAGNYTQLTAGTLSIEVLNAGQYGQLAVTGNADLAGLLNAAGGRPRRLLRARRPLAPGDPGGGPRPRRARRRAAPAGALRPAHRGRARARRGGRAARRARGAPPPPLARAPRDGAARRSRSAQERLWFLAPARSRSDPSTTSPSRCASRGALDAARSSARSREIVRRHEVLRTTLRAGGRQPGAGRPRRRRRSRSRVMRLADAALAEREDAARRGRRRGGAPALRSRRRARSLRARLLELDEEDHVLLADACTTSSPTAGRGASSTASSARSTRAFRAGEPSPLPELPIQYADYAALAARVALGRGARPAARLLEASSSTGRRRALDLPADRPRPPVQSHRGAQRAFALAGAARSAALADARAARGRDALHDAARGVRRAAPPLHRAGRRRGGHAHRGPHARRDRGAHRLLRQHAGRCASTARRRAALHARSSRACARPASAPTRTRTCPSSAWCRSSRPSRDPEPRRRSSR